MNKDNESATPRLPAFGNRKFEPDVWDGGEGTGCELSIIGPSLGRCTTAKIAPIDPKKLRGRVLNFNAAKRFGFIKVSPECRLFFHLSECGGAKSLTPGQRVAYEIGEDRNGRPAAVKVEVIGVKYN